MRTPGPRIDDAYAQQPGTGLAPRLVTLSENDDPRPQVGLSLAPACDGSGR